MEVSQKKDKEVVELIKADLFDDSPTAYVILDSGGRILDVNKRFTDWLGFGRKDAVGKKLTGVKFLSAKTKAIVTKKFLERIAGKELAPYEIEFITKSGAKIIGEIYGQPKKVDGKVVGELVVALEVTEKSRQRQEIEESESLYRSLFENMDRAFSYHEMVYEDGKAVDYIFLDINRAFERIMGVVEEEIEGKKLSEVFPEVMRDDVDWVKRYQKVVSTGLSETFVLESGALGKVFKVHAYSPDKGRFATIFEDVSVEEEKKKLESLKKRQYDNLGEVMVEREMRVVSLKNRVRNLEARLMRKEI